MDLSFCSLQASSFLRVFFAYWFKYEDCFWLERFSLVCLSVCWLLMGLLFSFHSSLALLIDFEDAADSCLSTETCRPSGHSHWLQRTTISHWPLWIWGCPTGPRQEIQIWISREGFACGVALQFYHLPACAPWPVKEKCPHFTTSQNAVELLQFVMQAAPRQADLCQQVREIFDENSRRW